MKVPRKMSQNEVPTHIGFIMDGNRHWARQNSVSLEEGYTKGVDAFVETVRGCAGLGVKHVTVYAFSTENWRRPDDQKKLLMTLFKRMARERINELIDIGARLNFIGRVEDFPKAVVEMFRLAEKKTEKGEKIVVNVAVSYGGRAEIVDAVKKIVEFGLDQEKITEESLARHIYAAGQPDPELIVRTSGEKRLSGFMLWQSAYSELYFTDINWPDFDGNELQKALEYYQNTKRNFGR